MSLRLTLAALLLVLLAGCVSVGDTDVLFTPIGVVALHSFKPPAPPESPPDVVASTTTLQDSGSLVTASAAKCTGAESCTSPTQSPYQ
jgi:hypothetical protein